MTSLRSSPNLTQKTFLNAASYLLNFGAGILVGLLLNPLLLTLLGPSLFGTWKICQRLLTYVSTADGRASQALKWTIANNRSVTDVEQKQREVGCAVVVWLRFLPLLLVSGGVISWYSPLFINDIPLAHFTIIRLTCAILVFNLLLFPLKSIPESVMIGMNLGYKTTWVNAVGALLGGAMMAGFAWIGWGLIGLASAFLLGSLFRGVSIIYLARKALPWLTVRRPESGEAKKFFSFSVWILVWTFIQRLLLSSDIIILGLISSAPLVASYVLTFYVIQSSVELSSLLVSSGMPGLGDIVGRGKLKKAIEVRSEIMTSSWLLVIIIGTMILLWNRPFISLWVGPDKFVGYGENLLMVLLMTQLIFIRIDAAIVDVTLEINTKVLLGALSTVVSLALAFILGSYLQSPITGVLVGLISGRLILSGLYPTLVMKNLHASPKVRFGIAPIHVRLTAVMIFLYGSAYFSAPLVKINGWAELILFATISLLVIFSVAFWAGFPLSQRFKLTSRIRQIAYKR